MDDGALIERVRTFVTERVPSLTAGAAVLAVSGGGDSVAMASLLLEAGIVRGGAGVIAWFDHRLRGEAESERERSTAAALSARYGIAMEAGCWAAPQPREAAARDARYQFLTDVARRRGVGVIATAHTEDDHVETIVMCQLRRAGPWGLRGIAAERPAAQRPAAERHVTERPAAGCGLTVARPVLGCTRAELRTWCAARGLAYVDDPSNDDRTFARNRVRHDLLPAMEVAERGVRARLLAMAAAAAVEVDAWERVAADLALLPQADIGAPHVALHRARLRAMDSDAAVHTLRCAAASLAGGAREYERHHYETMMRAARGRTGASYQLPHGIAVTVDADVVIVSLGALGHAPIAATEAHTAPWSGTLGAWRIDVRAAPPGAVVRGRRAGDRVRFRGGGTKKLQDAYVDAKVPRRERDAAPVVATGCDVLWSALLPLPGRAGASCDVRAERVPVPRAQRGP